MPPDIFRCEYFLTRVRFDLLGFVPLIEDVEKNSDDFKRSLLRLGNSEEGPLQQYRTDQLPFSYLSTPVPPEGVSARRDILSLSEIYDSLVNVWISPLSEHVPSQIRIFKEKLARAIAVQLALSSLVLFRKVGSHEPNESIDVESSGHSQSERPTEIFPASSFSEPTSSQLTHGMSTLEVDDNADIDTERRSQLPDYTTLRSYTPVNAQPGLSKRAANVLSHWTTGTDPEKYDWKSTVSMLRDEESQSEGDRRSREKRRKREERRQKRLSRSRTGTSTSQTPPVVKVWGSGAGSGSGRSSQQPQSQQLQAPPSGVGLLRSSQVAEEDIPMSQVERGLFGGRNSGRKKAVKERKKKRAAGF